MASSKTAYMEMNDWVGTDGIRRSEMSDNFKKLDREMADRGVSAARFGLSTSAADNSPAINAAIQYILTNFGEGTLIIPAADAKYKCLTPITYYTNRITLKMTGAVLSFSELSSGPAFILTANSGGSNQRHYIESLHIEGNELNTNTVGLFFNAASSALSTAQFAFYNPVIEHFGINIKFGSYTWCNYFYNTKSRTRNGTCLYMVEGDTFGENISFIGGTFYNSKEIGRIGWGTWNFSGVSFDYSKRIFTNTGGRVGCTNCHFESDDDSDYWLYASGNGALIQIQNSELWVTKPSNLGLHSNKEIGYTDVTTHTGGIEFTNTFLRSSRYKKGTLVAGPGRVVGRDITALIGDNHVPLSMSISTLPDGGFELQDYARSGFITNSGSNSPTIDTTEKTKGNASLKCTAPTGDCNFSVSLSIKPFDRVSLSFYAKSASGRLYVSFEYNSAAGTLLSSGTLTTIQGDSDWSLYCPRIAPPPAGSTSAKIRFNTGNGMPGVVWLDEVVINLN